MQHRIPLYVASTDSLYIARVDVDSLPQQTLMELLVEHINDKCKFQCCDGDFLPISEWENVQTNGGVVTQIMWSDPFGDFFPNGGSIDVRWIPRTVTHFDCEFNFLQGSIDFNVLPDAMEIFVMMHNHLHGTLDLTRMPSALTSTRLKENHLTGSIDLTRMPPRMRCIDLSKNKLSGVLNLGSLPRTMVCITLAHNEFTGVVDINKLSKAMKRIDLSHNKLGDDVVIDETITAHCEVVISSKLNEWDSEKLWR